MGVRWLQGAVCASADGDRIRLTKPTTTHNTLNFIVILDLQSRYHKSSSGEQ